MNGFHPTAARLAMRKLSSILALLVLAVAPALAQINSGSMSGTIADASGAVIPNAKVTAVEAQTGTVYNTVANAAGIYTLPSVLPGTYNVTVTATGFKQAEVKGLPVFVSNRTGHDFSMQPGESAVTVTVEADGPALDTQSSDVGTSISQQQVEDLAPRHRLGAALAHHAHLPHPRRRRPPAPTEARSTPRSAAARPSAATTSSTASAPSAARTAPASSTR